MVSLFILNEIKPNTMPIRWWNRKIIDWRHEMYRNSGGPHSRWIDEMKKVAGIWT